MKVNRELEKQLREEWSRYNKGSHPEDSMSFIDYVYNITRFKGHRVNVKESSFGTIEILFKKIP